MFTNGQPAKRLPLFSYRLLSSSVPTLLYALYFLLPSNDSHPTSIIRPMNQRAVCCDLCTFRFIVLYTIYMCGVRFHHIHILTRNPAIFSTRIRTCHTFPFWCCQAMTTRQLLIPLSTFKRERESAIPYPRCHILPSVCFGLSTIYFIPVAERFHYSRCHIAWNPPNAVHHFERGRHMICHGKKLYACCVEAKRDC